MSTEFAHGRHPSRWIAMASLAAIIGLMLYPEPTAWSVIFATPLTILVAAGFRPPRKWGGWVAALIIPYFAGALGEAIAAPSHRPVYWAITALTVVAFLSAFYLIRRTGINLRE